MSKHPAPFEVSLWPESVLPRIPETETYQIRSDDPEKPNGAVQFVSEPTLTVYLPDKVNAATPAVVICPGGAYVRIAIDKEGVATARWLNRLGIAALVLKYRLPRPEISGNDLLPWPLEDGYQAMRIVRANATTWNIDPQRTGLMGFSAGGHLASFVATHLLKGNTLADDKVGHQDARPNFLILIYPVTALAEVHGTRAALLGENTPPDRISAYSTETQVTPEAPPTFLVHAKDDASVPFQDALNFQAALQRVGVSCETHLFEHGGHAFGLEGEEESATWPARCELWFKSLGLLPE